jgi:hypothetical protein
VRRYQVYAWGQDEYWLKAVMKAADKAVRVEPILCPARCLEYLDRLPEADPEALMLVDATRQPDISAVVQSLRDQGWRYVVVVAADPSWKEARAVLRGTVGYDYWEKSYDPCVIQREIERCLTEMEL